MTLLSRMVLLTAAGLALAAPSHAQQGGVDTVGRAVAKRFAELGRLPAPQTIVVADLINYHRHDIPRPRAGEQVAVDLRWDAPLPAELGESVLQIGIATSHLHDAVRLPPLDLAVVVDRSGSMNDADKMQRVKQSLCAFIGRLRPQDRLALVAYSDQAETLLASRPVGDGRAARAAVDRIQADGSTNLHAGLMRGYAQLDRDGERERHGDVARRVILLTDGLANAGCTDPQQIAADSRACNDRGIDLSTIGVGRDFNHALLDTLAKAGRGSFHFVADEADIDKVFVDEAQSLMGIVARNVTLELDHGDDVEITRIYGHQPQRRGDGFRLGLDNFNFGMTRVVLVKFRRRDCEAPLQPIRVCLSYDVADGSSLHRRPFQTQFVAPDRGVVDPEVRKNFTIAVMARALRRMAESGAVKRYGDAERYLRRALAYARAQYPDTRDEDLVSIRTMLEKYRVNLSKRIELYRDL